MLTLMRKYNFLKIFLWLVIIAFLATIFIVWGVGDNKSVNYAAKVGDSVITFSELQASERSASELRKRFNDIDADSFRMLILEDMITNRLLLEDAERLKLTATDAEVRNYMVQSGIFNKNGVFDYDFYTQILKNNGLSSARYEEDIRRELTLDKMRGIIYSSVNVSEDEVALEYAYRNTKFNVSYFIIDGGRYKNADLKTPDEEEISAYFQLKQENYRVPSSIKVKYIMLDESKFNYSAPQITEETLQAYYNGNIGQYTTPEQVDLSHIVVNVSNWNDNESVKMAEDKIKTALSELKNGARFQDVAKKYSDDPLAASNGGKLGTLTRPDDELTTEEAVVFGLGKGAYSDVITTGYGFHIFKADDHRYARVAPFAEVKNEIKSKMNEEAYNAAYNEYIYGIYRDILKSGNITAYVQENPKAFKVTETDYIFENDPKAFFQFNEELKKSLFSMGNTDITSIIENSDGMFIYELVGRKDSYIPELSSVYEKVYSDIVSERAYSAAISDVEDVVNEPSVSKENFNSYARHFGVRTLTVPAFSKIEGAPKEVWAQNMADEIYSAHKDDVIIFPAQSDKLIYVIHIDSVIAPNVSDISKDEEEGIKSHLMSAKRTEALISYVNNLRGKTKVEISPIFFQ